MIAKMSHKIAFIHNYYIYYRVPLFELLAKKYFITFFFDALHSYTRITSKKIQFKIPLSVHFKGLTIPLSLWVYLVMGKYSLFIAGDATNISTIITFIISKIIKKPFILWEERWFWSRSNFTSILWPFVHLISLEANAIIVPGSKSQDFYINMGVRKERIFIAPNASYITILEQHRKKAQGLREEWKLTDKVVILYLGRVIRMKGVHILLKAFSRLCDENIKNAYLVIVGEAEHKYEIELDRLCENLGLCNVHFTGFAPESDKGTYFQLADIVVYPCLLEVWGLVINEGMSAEKAFISTNNSGGAYDLIQNNVNGYLIPAGNIQVLTDSLKKLIENPKLRREFGIAAKRVIELSYTYELMFEGFCKAIDHTFDKNPLLMI
jgi:glycosyltransferase involved in cell wall biosynthesis